MAAHTDYWDWQLTQARIEAENARSELATLRASLLLPNGRPLIDELRTAPRVHGKHSDACFTKPRTDKNPQGLGVCGCGLNYDLERLGA